MFVLQELLGVEKRVSQEQIEQYAKASGDFNPVHLDPEFAASTSFGGRIAHGMLILAFLSEMMALSFEDRWLESGRLKVRFRAPVFPGDKVTTYGNLVDVQEQRGATYARYNIACRNQNSEDVIVGEAWVSVD